MFIKQKYNTLLLFISISLTSCSSSIYQSFEEPILTENKFIRGLVTDGDLRREIKNYTKNKILKNFMTKNPMVVNENMPASKALTIMNEKKITSLLVVSDKDYKKKDKVLRGIIHIHSILKNGV